MEGQAAYRFDLGNVRPRELQPLACHVLETPDRCLCIFGVHAPAQLQFARQHHQVRLRRHLAHQSCTAVASDSVSVDSSYTRWHNGLTRALA